MGGNMAVGAHPMAPKYLNPALVLGVKM